MRDRLFFANIPTRDVSRVCVSLLCANTERAACVSTLRVRASLSTSALLVLPLIVVRRRDIVARLASPYSSLVCAKFIRRDRWHCTSPLIVPASVCLSSTWLCAYARSMCFCVYNRCVLSLRLALLSPAARRHTGVP